jgi:hypothetical protein
MKALSKIWSLVSIGCAMNSSTVLMVRAYLITASLAAASIEIPVLASYDLFDVSENVFASRAFRVGVVITVVGAVLATRYAARAAFRFALLHDQATFSRANAQSIAVSQACPLRSLVILHLRFNRWAVEVAGHA